MKTCPLCDSAYPNHHTSCPTDGALLIESHDLEPGTVIRGKYRIVRLLGHGGMGTVYLAEHILLGQQRALKFISSELSQDPRFLKRFRHEAQAAIKLRHPNVVEVVDLDQAEDGSPYIAMEYVEGEDLRHALAASHPQNECHPERSMARSLRHTESKDLLLPFGAFPVERALAIARGIAQGLGAAHLKGIVHRDVKPENILLSGGNGAPETPKLLDFGIAAIQESSTAITRTHGLLLTPPYAAPEQWQGMASEQLDGRADLYALGGVLYEILTAETCFHSHNLEGWMGQHLSEAPQPPSRTRPELANWRGLDQLVLRLLAKNRDDRPRDAAELVALLDAVEYAEPNPPEPRTHRTPTVAEIVDTVRSSEPMARTTTAPPPPNRVPKRFPRWAWGALAILAVVSVFASWRLLAPIPGPAPEFSPAPGAYATAQTIRISDAATRGLTIYYTTNGTAPSTSSQAYTPDGIKVQQSQTIRAIAVADGYSQSAEASAAYTITPPPMPQQPGITPSPTPQQPGTTPPPTPQQPGTTPAPPLHQPTIAEIEQEALAFYNQKRYPEAAPLFEQACAGGIGEACNHLGFMHENGNGVALDNSQAIALYSKACMANYVLGCFDLGVMYEHGRGVPQDEAYVRAAAEYSIVCDANGGAGCSNLGNLYWHGGNGLVKDNEKARLYLTKGCSLGNQWGCDRLKLVH